MTLDEAIKHCEEVTEKNEIKASWFWGKEGNPNYESCIECAKEHRQLATWLRELKQLREQTRWILVSKKLPEDLEPVNITWVNHNPESYYADIKDKPFTATGVYYNGQWYWYSTLCTDILKAYGHNHDDIIDDDIEITAWMPLPKGYKGESEE